MNRIAVLLLLVVIGCTPAIKPQSPEANTATMVFYGGFGPAILVMLDGYPMGGLPFGEVTRFRVAPGEHALWAKTEGTFGVPTTVRLAPEEVAFFSYRYAMRYFAQVDEKQFNKEVALDAGRVQRKGSGK